MFSLFGGLNELPEIHFSREERDKSDDPQGDGDDDEQKGGETGGGLVVDTEQHGAENRETLEGTDVTGALGRDATEPENDEDAGTSAPTEIESEAALDEIDGSDLEDEIEEADEESVVKRTGPAHGFEGVEVVPEPGAEPFFGSFTAKNGEGKERAEDQQNYGEEAAAIDEYRREFDEETGNQEAEDEPKAVEEAFDNDAGEDDGERDAGPAGLEKCADNLAWPQRENLVGEEADVDGLHGAPGGEGADGFQEFVPAPPLDAVDGDVAQDSGEDEGQWRSADSGELLFPVKATVDEYHAGYGDGVADEGNQPAAVMGQRFDDIATAISFQLGSSLPRASILAPRTRGRRRSLGSVSIFWRRDAPDSLRYLRPASSYGFPAVSRRPGRVNLSMNRLISPGAMGFVFRSMSWRGIRRSLKNRSAARVALEPLTPKIWTSCISIYCGKFA